MVGKMELTSLHINYKYLNKIIFAVYNIGKNKNKMLNNLLFIMKKDIIQGSEWLLHHWWQ